MYDLPYETSPILWGEKSATVNIYNGMRQFGSVERCCGGEGDGAGLGGMVIQMLAVVRVFWW